MVRFNAAHFQTVRATCLQGGAQDSAATAEPPFRLALLLRLVTRGGTLLGYGICLRTYSSAARN